MPYFPRVQAETPAQNYYPSAKVKLIVRFDEFEDGQRVRLKAPAKTTINLTGSGKDTQAIEVVDDPTAPEGVRRLLLKPRGESFTPVLGLAGTSSEDGYTHELCGIVPQKTSWKFNGIREADALTCTLRWVDAPIDPRVIRSCGIEFYLGTVSPEEYGEGMRGGARVNRSSIAAVDSIEPANLVPDSWIDSNGIARTNRRFRGWVNKWVVNLADGLPVVELDCQDSTVLLIKQPQPMKGSVDTSLPIDKAIAGYLASFPQLAGMSVEYRPAGVEPKPIKDILAGSRWPPHIGIPMAKAGGSGDGDQATVWDYLTNVCGSIGHNVRLDDLTVVIQQVQTLVDGKATPRNDDPYRERFLASGNFPVRTFVYGANVMSAKLTHEYTKKEAKNIEVRCYNPERKNTLVVRFPEKGDRVVSPLPGDDKVDTTWHIKKVTAVVDLATLKKIAEAYYNLRGRNELAVEIETRNLASWGGGNDDPDILDIKVGDAFEFHLNREGFGAVATVHSDLSDQAKCEQLMLSRGFSSGFSRAYARAYTSAGFQRRFVLKEGSINWDVNDGVKISLTGINYVEARVDKPSDDTVATRDQVAAREATGTPPPPTFDPILGADANGNPVIG